jgi:cytochrome c biogenesis protein ResB
MVVREVLGASKIVVLILAVAVVELVLLLLTDHLSVWPQAVVEVVDTGITTTKMLESLVEYILGQLRQFMQ